MSSTDDKVEEMMINVNEIKVLADVVQSQCITISKLWSATQAARRGMDMLVKENHSQSVIIARLNTERDSALQKLQTLQNSQPGGRLLEKISRKLNDLETGVFEEMSQKLDDLWEESKKRRT